MHCCIVISYNIPFVLMSQAADVRRRAQIRMSQSADVGISHLMKTTDSFVFNEWTICDHKDNSKANFYCLGMSFISEIARQVFHLQCIVFKRSKRVFAFGSARSLVVGGVQVRDSDMIDNNIAMCILWIS